MKRIVICCDGTWNTPDELKEGVPVPTNVVRLYNAVAENDKNGTEQHKYYHPGVGTEGSWWDKAVGGGTGKGLDKNIMSAYRELCDYYEPGDDIYMFGFSRGAYTVRSLGGLMSHAGLLDPAGLTDRQIWERIERVFTEGYRKRSEDRRVWDRLGWGFRNAADQPVPIRFLGVWDTVGALGIPDDMALLNLIVDSLHDYTFHDTKLGDSVRDARHAVALDELRASFQPTLWTTAREGVKQVWFPGVHSDVGGGYREIGLSDGALKWMVKEAEGCGLVFDEHMVEQIVPNHLDALHDSCKGAFALLATQPRSAPEFVDENKDNLLDKSAIDRHDHGPIFQSPYRPTRDLPSGGSITMDIFAIEPWTETGIWLEKGKQYDFKAEGEWMDGSIKCGPGGTADGHFQFAEVAQVAGTLLGKAETLFKRLTGNTAADFRFTKRHEKMPWFCLVGAIANGGGVDAQGHLQPHEAFQIGDVCSYVPANSGYLYAYANDAWNCYGNNRGRVTLTVKQI